MPAVSDFEPDQNSNLDEAHEHMGLAMVHQTSIHGPGIAQVHATLAVARAILHLADAQQPIPFADLTHYDETHCAGCACNARENSLEMLRKRVNDEMQRQQHTCQCISDEKTGDTAYADDCPIHRSTSPKDNCRCTSTPINDPSRNWIEINRDDCPLHRSAPSKDECVCAPWPPYAVNKHCPLHDTPEKLAANPHHQKDDQK